ncbi:DUF983 domain-containing protein [Aurantimonas sp. VKM B-3413]|uniref:DUF983 domain-containing protein n=1 Tax=Aurantimonas sp. VKM B-3413 TaxID=2779401 RepID=UPI001E53281E|nr:DUF983 domain-containing protein [Aurantimonas sp. VKM B-3413]MCB8839153.1 DUF983 domain-containing protein [Aurantimonas sp. VKM B-3413]
MNEDKAIFAPVDPAKAGLRGRCPRCGEGKLFSGYLTTAPRCSHCGLDYTFIDSGDGPAVFVILIIGFVVCALALWMEVSLNPPLWVHFLLWIPLIFILSLPLLRMLKGLMIGLQYKNRAAEGRLERND